MVALIGSCEECSGLPGLDEVTLLADNDTWDFLLSRIVEDLVVNDRDHLERVAVCDAVDENVAVDADSMLRV